MKLYIPTTSLNFNNILSTESISPKAFYAQRGFGYSRWFTIPENDMDGAILLYESPAFISRPLSDIEDHPLLIEIDTDEDFPSITSGVRYSQHTIYFNPWNTVFYFQTERDKTISLSMSDSSLETKLIKLYFNKIRVHTFLGCFPNVDKYISIDTSSIQDDIILNKIKGLLYGYYIGANLSGSSFDDIKKLNILREIQNIFAAIISSQEKVPTNTQKIRLSELFPLLFQFEPLYSELLKEAGSIQIVDRIVTILKKYGFEVFRINWEKLVDELQYDNNGQNYAISWINIELEKHKKLMMQKTQLLSVDDNQILFIDKKVTQISKDVIPLYDENKLYLHWVNNLFVQNKYSGKISSMKAELADDLTQAAITCMGESWKDSEIRTYLNQLRKHVRGEEFTQPWKNGLLSSIVAVITKGDDWEQLLRFLQTKELTDYRIAFSFYGILNGYANLTRDFTDNLYNRDSKYISEVYREFHGQLHNIAIQTNKLVETTNNNLELANDSCLAALNSTNVSISVNEIWNYFRSPEFKSIKKKTHLEKGLNKCIDILGLNFTPQMFVEELASFDKYGWSKNNKSWNLMCEKFCPSYKVQMGGRKKRINKKNEQSISPSLWDDPENKLGQNSQKSIVDYKLRKNVLLLNDKQWIEECLEFIVDAESKKRFIEDITWFVDNHNEWYHDKKKGNVQGFYYKRETSNFKTIERLEKYLENKLTSKNEKMQWLVAIYKKIPIDEIINYLIKNYADK